MNLLATYTYAKSLDNTTNIAALGNEGSEYSNAYHRRADYGPSENDIRQRIAASSIYQLPYGPPCSPARKQRERAGAMCEILLIWEARRTSDQNRHTMARDMAPAGGDPCGAA